MGIHDRDYIRDQPLLEPGARHGAPAHSIPVLGTHPAIKVIIGINFIIWMMWAGALRSIDGVPVMMAHFTASQNGLSHGYVHGLITSCFSHVEAYHLAINMIFLWWAGRAAEEFVGGRNFFFLYVVCGWVGALVHVLVLDLPILGASGSVMGMIVIAALCDRRRALSFLGLFTTSVGSVALFFVGFTLLVMIADPSRSFGDLTHLAGAVTGWVAWRFHLRVFPTPTRDPFGFAQAVTSTPGSSSAPAARPGIDAETVARMEALLEKISSEGIDALSEEEKQFLAEASMKYRK